MKKRSLKLLQLNKKVVANFKSGSIYGGSSLQCTFTKSILDYTCHDCDPHTTDPGEVGPCTETIR